MRLLIIIFLLFTPVLTFAILVKDEKQVSLYWGSTYRFDNNFYHSFDVSFERFKFYCFSNYYRGFGIRLDNFKNNNFSMSARYFSSFRQRPNLMFTPYIGISPVVFRMENKYGLNMKPEIGLRFNTRGFARNHLLSVSTNISYGYDIPIVNQSAFMVNRNDLSAKIALTIYLNKIGRYIQMRKKMKTNEK